MVGTRDLAPPMDGGAITTRVLRNAKRFVQSAKCLSHRQQFKPTQLGIFKNDVAVRCEIGGVSELHGIETDLAHQPPKSLNLKGSHARPLSKLKLPNRVGTAKVVESGG
jgi:hypothetical protein